MAAKVGKDLTTVTGRNLKYIEDVTKFDPLITSTQMLREELRKPEEVPESEKWVIEEQRSSNTMGGGGGDGQRGAEDVGGGYQCPMYELNCDQLCHIYISFCLKCS